MSIETETLADRLKAEQSKLGELRERREAVEVDVELGREAARRAPRGAGLCRREALELLGDQVDDDVEQPDLAVLERNLAIVTKACEIQESRVLELTRRHAREEYERRRPEHAGLIDDLANAVENLRDCLEAETAFRHSFGSYATMLPAVSWRSFPWLRKLLVLNRGTFRRDQTTRFDV